jgi:galactokinase/mevalonate kinase-like predicted kinase
MVDDAYSAYIDNDFKFMGKLIDSYWRIKTQLDPNSANEFIYRIYSDCRLAGAWGGKMDENTMIILAPKEKHEEICTVMKDHIRLNSSVKHCFFIGLSLNFPSASIADGLSVNL